MERKSLKYRFAVLYIVSIVLMAVIFAVLWNLFNSSSAAGFNNNKVTAEAEVLKQDELLHEELKKLQQLDEKFATLLADSASEQALGNVNEMILKAETAFDNTINTVENKNKTFNDSSYTVPLDGITSAFKSALNNRKSFGYMRAALLGKSNNISADERQFIKLKMELEDKNNKILTLENEVKNQKKSISDNLNTASGGQENKEIQILQVSIKKHEESFANLQASNTSLTKDNSRLTAQLNEYKSNTALTRQDKTEPKNINYQNRIENLDAELIFTKIDCNLSRADAKQIVSNFRQRKDLLEESLKALTNLSHSSNVAVQKKAKEKLSQLQSVASTLHD